MKTENRESSDYIKFIYKLTEEKKELDGRELDVMTEYRKGKQTKMETLPKE
jgi:hypothetical protein